jgi:hypothetical protein
VKLTTTEWTNVQNAIYPDHPILDAKIEDRTFGKLWRQPVAIRLSKDEQRIVMDALAKTQDPDDTEPAIVEDLTELMMQGLVPSGAE